MIAAGNFAMHLLVGLLEHMGDIVACEPVSRYLKAHYPTAHLTWAVSTPYRELIDTNPFVDETLVLECLTDWIKLTKHGFYDKVVDLHVNYRICQHCRIPLVKETGNPFVNAYRWYDYGTLLESFTLGAGLPPLCAAPQLYLQPEHAKAVDALGLPSEFCVVHLESNSSDKDWRRDRWRQVCKWISHELRLKVIEIGGGKTLTPSPLPLNGSISLANRLSILESAEVIRRAAFFVGVDSGPAHLANALQVPGVVLLRHYMPFNGFFASDSPLVKLVRNLAGPVSALGVDEVIDAVRYVAGASVMRREAPRSAAVEVAAGCSEQMKPDFARHGFSHVTPFGGPDGKQPTTPFRTLRWVWRHPRRAVSRPLKPIEKCLIRPAGKWLRRLLLISHVALTQGPKCCARMVTEGRRLLASGVFDTGFYLRRNPDLAWWRAAPEWHYLLHCATEGRAPCQPHRLLIGVRCHGGIGDLVISSSFLRRFYDELNFPRIHVISHTLQWAKFVFSQAFFVELVVPADDFESFKHKYHILVTLTPQFVIYEVRNRLEVQRIAPRELNLVDMAIARAEKYQNYIERSPCFEWGDG